MTPTTSEADLRSTTVLGAMLRHKVTVIVCLTIGILGGLAYAIAQPLRPAATALLVVRDPHATGVGPDGSITSRYTADQANLLRSPAVANNASSLLARAKPPVRLTPSQIMSALTVGSSDTNNTLKVTFGAGSKAAALAGTNAVVQAYRSSVTDVVHKETAAELAAIDAALAKLNSEQSGRTLQMQAQLQAQTQLAMSQLLAQRAQLVVLDANPSPGVAASSQPHLNVPTLRSVAVRDVGFGLVLGLLAAALLSYLIATRRRRLFDASDAQDVLGVAALASFKSEPTAATSTVAGALAAVSLDELCKKSGARLVAVISAGRRTNTGNIAHALAGGYATTGREAFVIDLTAPGRGPGAPGANGSRGFAQVAEQLAAASGSDVVLVAMPDFREPDAEIEILTRMDGAVAAVYRGQRSRTLTELGDGLARLGAPLIACVFLASRRPGSAGAPVTHPSPGSGPVPGAKQTLGVTAPAWPRSSTTDITGSQP